MNPSETLNTTGAPPCPKRLWVLAALSDDEALPPDGSLPSGLRFHLLRCPSCRLDADRLTAVSGSLRELSEETPAVSVLDRANEQLEFALSHGAILSGRLSIPDDIADERAESDTRPKRISALNIISRFAAAAVVAFAVGWAGIGFFDYSRSNDDTPRRSSRMAAPAVTISQSIDRGVSPQQDQASDQVIALTEDEYEPRPTCSDSLESGSGLGRDTRCEQRAFSLPIRDQNRSGPRRASMPLDNPPPPVSTTRLPNE